MIDSPYRSVADHVRRYVETDGADGYMDGGVANLLLTTVGRKSGKLRRTALFYGEDDGRYVLVASNVEGGLGDPLWYLNLLDHPEVQVQVRAETFTARARTAEGDERTRLWQLMTSHYPEYDVFATQSSRVIPVVLLERV